MLTTQLLLLSHVLSDSIALSLSPSYYAYEMILYKHIETEVKKIFQGQQELPGPPGNRTHTSAPGRANEGDLQMAVPRSRRGGNTQAAGAAATPSPASVAAGINLSALPAAPGTPPALNLLGGASAATPPVGGFVDLTPVNTQIAALNKQVETLGASLSAAISSLAALVNDVYARLGEVANDVAGLYEDGDGGDEPVTPEEVAAAAPPKGKGKGKAADTFEDVPMQDALKPALSQLNGHDLATVTISLKDAMAQHGHPNVDPNRIAAWITSLGIVGADGKLNA